MARQSVGFRVVTIVLLLVLGGVVVAGLAAAAGPAESAVLPAAGLLFGGLYLAWEEVAHRRYRRH